MKPKTEDHLRLEISRLQGRLREANTALAKSNRTKDALHRIVEYKREQFSDVLKRLGELRSKLDITERNLLCEQGAYMKIVGFRRDDIKSFEAHRDELLKRLGELRSNEAHRDELLKKIETLNEVVRIERAHSARCRYILSRVLCCMIDAGR